MKRKNPIEVHVPSTIFKYKKSAKDQQISVIVPVYNEVGNIKQFHKEVCRSLKKITESFEIIYVDDRSSDGTWELLQQLRGIPTSLKLRGASRGSGEVVVLRKQGKQGKAYSLMEGFEKARGNIFVMIDGDLQYPPSAIPKMVKMLASADIVIANRKTYKDSILRKFTSNTFRFIFGKMLFGITADIQSGLKVFKRKVYETVKFKPISPWTFDLEFLNRSIESGFTYKNIDITFSERLSGTSKVSVFRAIVEIGLNAFIVKSKGIQPLYIPSKNPQSMEGAGIGFKKKKYITHSTLPFSLLALKTFTAGQITFLIILGILVAIGIYLTPLHTARVIVGILSILYFIDSVFSVTLIYRSLDRKTEISFTPEELSELDDSNLPVYTILCPLYKEWQIVPQFLKGIEQIEWPKEKLDVMLLLEEDDNTTIAAIDQMDLPFYVRKVIVPDSQPKTKPKACNYGLAFAKGEYLVIYDAEDMPEPNQLKKAYAGFKKAGEKVICLQAKLNYYNVRQNLLTRFFTAEYSLWFDLTLTGLQSLNSSIPLGGTSNHFKTQKLRDLQGWDPFNVTEDADLGIRLFKKGFRTQIIDSTTYEEATSKVRNWLRQRSRWIKGYMQTYLVHMRHIGSFIREEGLKHNFIFQLTVGGKILFILLNPLMWVLTFSYFAFYDYTAQIIESVFIPPVSYFAVVSWVFGNFFFFYLYMVGCAKKQQWDLAKYTVFIPFYWVLMSISAGIAFYQLLFKPHYWEKTTHGFHLPAAPEPAVEQPYPAPAPKPVYAPAPAWSTSFTEKFTSRWYALNLSRRFQSHPLFTYTKGGAATMINTLTDTNNKVINKRKKFLTRKTRNWTIFQAMPTIMLLTLDVILARFLLPSSELSTYILLSTVGKSLFIFSQLFGYLTITIFETRKRKEHKFYTLIFFTFLYSWIGFILFGLKGSSAIPLIFGSGSEFEAIIPYSAIYLYAFMCYSVANIFTSYHRKQRNYSYKVILVGFLTFQTILLLFLNGSILDFIYIPAYMGSFSLFAMFVLQLNSEMRKMIENNSESIFGLFSNNSFAKKVQDNKHLRILIFNWRDTKHIYSGGAEVYIHELAKRWIKEGYKVTQFCGNDNKNKPYDKIDGIEVIRRGGTYTIYLFAVIYYFFKFRGKYDVIIDCENGIPFFTPLFVRKPVILLIFHVHQEIFRKFLRFPLNVIARFLEGELMPHVYRDNQVVTISDSSKTAIENLGFTQAQNIKIIHSGISGRYHLLTEKTAYPSVFYIGRLKEYKQIDVAIKAFAQVHKQHKNAKFVIAGSGEYCPVLRDLVQELGLEKSIKFLGKVSEKRKIRLLAESWVVVQPSQIEGWGITVIEANAAGTPVIASRVNGLVDSVMDNQTGLLVKSGNIHQFAVAMQKLITDDGLRKFQSGNALAWSMNFNWDKSAYEFYKVIEERYSTESIHPTLTDIFFPGIRNT